MNILAISGSSRLHGNTEILLDQALQGARQEGAETELYPLAGKHLEPCDGCRSCDKIGHCHIKDDVTDVLAKMLAADAILLGTPIYSYSMTPQIKTVIDRTVSLKRPWGTLNNKVAGVVVTGGSLGLADALKDLYFWIVTRQMLPANFVAAYSLDKGDVIPLEKCMQAAFNLGRQAALLVSQKFTYPAEIDSAKHGYGTWVK
jgi:multimeric flavodoxin WrbA